MKTAWMLVGIVLCMIPTTGCQILRNNSARSEPAPVPATDEATSIASVSGQYVRPKQLKFKPSQLSLTEVMNQSYDKDKVDSSNNSKKMLVSIQRGSSFLVMPASVAEYSELGFIHVVDGDSIQVQEESYFRARNIIESAETQVRQKVLATMAENIKKYVKLEFDEASASEINQKILALKEDDYKKCVEPLANNSLANDYPLGAGWNGALINMRTIGPVTINNNNVANFEKANQALQKVQNDWRKLDEQAFANSEVEVYFNQEFVRTTNTLRHATTASTINFPDQNYDASVAIVELAPQDDNQNFRVRVVIPIVGFTDDWSRGFTLSPGDKVFLYRSYDSIPLVRQAKLQPRIEKILQRRDQQLSEGRRLFDRFRIERRRRYPVSSRLPSTVGAYVRPLEKRINNVSRNTRRAVSNLIR